MINTGKCPHCEKNISYVHFEGVEIRQPFQTGGWKGLSYCCPHCKYVLSIQIDPIALRNDIVNSLNKERMEAKLTNIEYALNHIQSKLR